MKHDVVPLWNFYYSSHLGKVAQRSLQRSIRAIWPNCRGMNVAGYGFAAPLLRPFRQEAARTICLMPASQGAGVWPREGPNATALVEEGHWPIPAGFLDRIVVAHALETEGHLDRLMEEIWRVLSPEGRVIVVAPNRSGIWARTDSTPFGIGRPYSFGQLEHMLEKHRLAPVTRAAALYMPPSTRRFWLRSSGALERFGNRMDAQRLAGVLIVEASKRVFAVPRDGAKEHAGILQPIRDLTRPVAEPARNRDRPVGQSRAGDNLARRSAPNSGTRPTIRSAESRASAGDV